MNQKINFKFFTKNNGFSNGKYKSLNCGIRSQDNPKHVHLNILKAMGDISKKPKKLILPTQSHSNKCQVISKFKKEYFCDGIVSNNPNFVLGITTADCIPIIFYDEINQNIGICHAGWKGLVKGIIENTIKKMKVLGSSSQDITTVIGPSIRQISYEVTESFIDSLPINYQQFSFLNKSKYYFNLQKLASYILFNQSVREVKDFKKNTFLDKNYFSYRESKKNNWNDYGRNISLITIN